MLHCVNKSPFERGAMDSCLRLAQKGSPILLYEDGVYAAQAGTAITERIKAAAKDHTIYVLGPDLRARGIDDAHLVEGVTVVDYGGFVDLVVEHGPTQSWL